MEPTGKRPRAGIGVGWSGIFNSAEDPEDIADDLVDMAYDTGTENAMYGNRIVDNYGMANQYLTDEHEEFLPDRGPEDQGAVCGNEYNGAMGESCLLPAERGQSLAANALGTSKRNVHNQGR